MKHLALPVIAVSSLSIRADHAPEGATTAQLIPGATVLGSLAAAHRILRSKKDAEFVDLFLNEQVSIPSLCPAAFKMDTFHQSNLPVTPLPKTAQSCKRFSGFQPLRGEITNEKRHGIRDSLLDWAVFSLLLEEQHAVRDVLTSLGSHLSCAYNGCKQAMDHVPGYYRRDRRNPERKMKARVDTHLQTRTGINRSWGVVEEGILYNREVFDEEMRFWGEVILPDGLADTFTKFVKEADQENMIHIGTGRTRGLGRVYIDFVNKVELPEVKRGGLEDLRGRLEQFDRILKKQAEEAGVNMLDKFYFALTLHSPAILCDMFLRYHTTLDAATLTDLLSLSTGTLRKIYQATGMQRITGWNELWGTPRMNNYALETGSTFLFASTHELNGNLLQALFTLEETGLGQRRSEGFGRICLSDPFHLEREQA